MNRVLANFNRHQYRFLASAVLIAGVASLIIPGRPPRISWASFNKIAIGMTQTEVEEILGEGQTILLEKG